MNATKARLIIWNPESYSREEVKAAAVWILGWLGARREDIDQASLVV